MTDPVPSKDLLPFTWEWDADARTWRLSMVEMGDGLLAGYDHLAGYYERRLIEEIQRLRTALRGVQSCSTCEACRGAATLALGGATPEPEPTHFAFLIKRPRDKEAWPTIFASREGAEGYEHRASEVVPVRLAQPPGAGQG